MNKISRKESKIPLVIFSILTSGLGFFIGFYLLFKDKFTGSEFAAFTITFSIIALIIAFSSEVQEFSIVGNIVKLKEVKKDVEEAIDELKQSRLVTFKFLLTLAQRSPGGFASDGVKDSRLDDFWFLHQQIIEFGIERELVIDICETAQKIIPGQFYRVCNYSDELRSLYNKKDYPEPQDLFINAFKPKSVSKTAKRLNKTEEEIQKILEEGIDEYRKLCELRDKCKKTASAFTGRYSRP